MSQLKDLAKPFNEKLVQRKPGSKGGDYVSHSSVTERALSVVGAYSVGPVELIRGYAPEETTKSATFPAQENVVVGALVTIRCVVDGREVSVIEAGDVENPLQKSNDGARAKDAMSDAVKRCWMRLGLGLALWSQDDYFLHKLLTRNEAESAPETPEPVAPTAVTPERENTVEAAPVAAETPVQETAIPEGIGPGRAREMLKALAKLGLTVEKQLALFDRVTKATRDVIGIEPSDLTVDEAKRVMGAAKREAEAAKPVWEKWQSDEDARSYGAKSGTFSQGGHTLMLAWDEVKAQVGKVSEGDLSNLYRRWFEFVNARVELDKKADAREEAAFHEEANHYPPDPKAA